MQSITKSGTPHASMRNRTQRPKQTHCQHAQNMVPKFSLTSLNGFRGLAGFPLSSVAGLRCL